MSGFSTEAISTHLLIKERVRIVELANLIEGVGGSLSQQLDVFLVKCRDEWPERQERQQHQCLQHYLCVISAIVYPLLSERRL